MPPGGKWKYGGRFSLPADTQLWDDDIIEKIATAQKVVGPEAITSRKYHLVVDETSVPDGRFFKAMWPAI